VRSGILPSCPRCGYDQSGEIARWNDSAAPPTPRGTCVECGLNFEWIDVLDPSRRNLPGFFEHSRGFMNFFASAWQTWSWTVLPWRFWSRVQMHHDVRAKRALCWVLALWASVSWIVALETLAIVLHFRSSTAFFGRPQPLLQPSDWWIPAWPFVTYNDEASNWASGLNGDTGMLGWRAWPVIPTIIFGTPVGVWTAVLANLGFAIMLATLPHTRSAAKLRIAHLMRGAGFGFGWLASAMLLLIVEQFHFGFRVLSGGSLVGSVSYLDLLFADYQWVVLAWIALWWWSAIKIGYRIERWKTVGIAATVPVALAIYVFRVWIFAYFGQ